ncbi:tryptophan-rich sensory protein [Sporosarcina highlanderae]|uniref:Tryptophan-rich sensory protein n=1 Tax=Sporosarcina highlanderae TaxID=3035916 RepID=A0ABT8JT70_9BACL|nr:tryptophan-rich sensory protein [Sporosarcina highlanderae]MDN4608366.1 tryptophan-rich sensory protein [Sporosarcina highlanderae]
MSRIIMMSLSLIAVIVLNVIARFFSLNGFTTGEIANRLPVLFIPADYVLLLLGIAMILLFNWVINFNKAGRKLSSIYQNRVVSLFILCCILHIAWIFLWHYGLFYWTVVVKGALLLLLLVFYFSYPKRENRLLGRVPFSLLIGWSVISTITNLSYTLMINDWSGMGLSDPLWTVIYLTVATAFALHFMYHHRDYVMNLAFVWAFIGIAIKNGTEELFISAAAIFLCATIITCIFLFSGRQMENKNRVGA